ncbi:hypothetical protein K2X33_02630 [bacterium]|nr:hypothetical protein [bacterium]
MRGTSLFWGFVLVSLVGLALGPEAFGFAGSLPMAEGGTDSPESMKPLLLILLATAAVFLSYRLGVGIREGA